MAKNRTKATHLLLSLALAVAFSLNVQAAATRAPTFTKALPIAKSKGQPLLVLVHGSSWHTASQRLNDLVWQDYGFSHLLSSSVVMTSIHIRQNQTKDAAELEKKNREGWNKSISTYPAVQVYSSDGQILATMQGRALIKSATAEKLAALLNPLIEAANLRTKLLSQYQSAAAAGKHTDAIKKLCQLNELPINKEPDILKMLERVDPSDRSGWQAQISFSGWDYMRDITKRLEEGQAVEVLAETERALKSRANTPDQRTIIYGARGRALVALDRKDDAWICFQKAAAEVPNSANGKAVLNYGRRVTGAESN